jgi:hypothetical protein
MDLGELSIACLFGSRTPPAHYEVGLQWRGEELAVGGYKRVTVARGEWLSTGTVATAAVHFDGFGAPANIDAIIVYLPDGAALPPVPLDGDLHLGMADTAIDLEATVDMTPGPVR